MELKHCMGVVWKYDIFFLLIVPYGIETTQDDIIRSVMALLIVPYGIET